MHRLHRLVGTGLLAMSAVATAQGPRLAVLDAITPGSWTLHETGTTGPDRAICVTDANALVQIHHAATACSRFVVAEGPRSATVHYTCPGQGHGRTTITVEGSSLIRIQTQGIAGGAPFDVDYEARRGGACARSAGN